MTSNKAKGKWTYMHSNGMYIRAFYLNVKDDDARSVDSFQIDLLNMRNMVGADCVVMPWMVIGGKILRLICARGLLDYKSKVSGLTSEGEPVTSGNLIVTGMTPDNDFRSLDDDEIDTLTDNLGVCHIEAPSSSIVSDGKISSYDTYCLCNMKVFMDYDDAVRGVSK